jgi:ribosomal protein S18 acetylase RimI-like enzyme
MDKEISQLILNISGHDPKLNNYIDDIKYLDSFMDYPWSDEHWDNLRINHHYRISVMIINNQVKAFSLYTEIVDELHLLKILVDPSCRRMGHAKNLLKNNLEEYFINSKSCFLEVREDNHSAVKLYTNLGFILVHKVNSFYSDGCTALKMSLTYSNT